MELAASIYKGGELICAAEADYSTSRELGLICPFCKESVFWVKAHHRGQTLIRAAWRHYKTSTNTSYCENRALSREGKAELKAMQPQAHNQRLKLFNRRFWEIFRYGKFFPADLRKTCSRLVGEETLDRMVVHCHQRWHVREILRVLPAKIDFRMGGSEAEKGIRQHPALSDADAEVIEKMVQDFTKIKFSTLRYKILCEAIEWLGTKSALPAFTKLIELSFLDCIEALPPPIHSQQVAEMAILSLVLTDWEKAIDSLKEKTKAIGFG